MRVLEKHRNAVVAAVEREECQKTDTDQPEVRLSFAQCFPRVLGHLVKKHGDDDVSE